MQQMMEDKTLNQDHDNDKDIISNYISEKAIRTLDPKLDQHKINQNYLLKQKSQETKVI